MERPVHEVLEQADLFVHARRPKWGLAIHTASRPSKVEFLFQDGTVRSFHEDFLHLFRPADKPRDVTERVLNRLRARAEGSIRTPHTVGTNDVPPLPDQVRLFHHLFPMGFEDPRFVARHRGQAGSRRIKANCALAMEDAQETLTRELLSDRVAAGDGRTVVALMCDLLSRTSLVGRSSVKALEARLDAVDMQPLAESLYHLLYDEEANAFDRFTRWVIALEEALGEGPKWALVTALPGLIHPDRHVVVKRNPFQREAAWMAPSLTLSRVPNATLYQRVLTMTESLRQGLIEFDLAPKDLLDVATFIRVVMRPKHMAMLKTLPADN